MKLSEISSELKYHRPLTKVHLKEYVNFFFHVLLPSRIYTPGHSTPLDYLWYTFNADFLKIPRDNSDCVVWANRGGGKTQTAAIATLLDCIFKPDIQVRILSGSAYQAGRMYEYFQKYLAMGFSDLIWKIEKRPTSKTIFKNGATVEVLVQSLMSVRGQHVHKLRCDEIELFQPKIFEAAKYTTMSTLGYVGSMEIISTQHKRYGLMKKILDKTKSNKGKIFKWNVWEVIEKCKRNCAECPLRSACREKAKDGRGYLKVSDIVNQLQRTKKPRFNLEVLCGEGKVTDWGHHFKSRLY